MFSTIVNIFRIPELRRKILFTIALLGIYRLGFYVPLPGMNQHKMAEAVNLISDLITNLESKPAGWGRPSASSAG